VVDLAVVGQPPRLEMWTTHSITSHPLQSSSVFSDLSLPPLFLSFPSSHAL